MPFDHAEVLTLNYWNLKASNSDGDDSTTDHLPIPQDIIFPKTLDLSVTSS